MSKKVNYKSSSSRSDSSRQKPRYCCTTTKNLYVSPIGYASKGKDTKKIIESISKY